MRERSVPAQCSAEPPAAPRVLRSQAFSQRGAEMRCAPFLKRSKPKERGRSEFKRSRAHSPHGEPRTEPPSDAAERSPRPRPRDAPGIFETIGFMDRARGQEEGPLAFVFPFEGVPRKNPFSPLKRTVTTIPDRCVNFLNSLPALDGRDFTGGCLFRSTISIGFRNGYLGAGDLP